MFAPGGSPRPHAAIDRQRADMGVSGHMAGARCKLSPAPLTWQLLQKWIFSLWPEEKPLLRLLGKLSLSWIHRDADM